MDTLLDMDTLLFDHTSALSEFALTELDLLLFAR